MKEINRNKEDIKIKKGFFENDIKIGNDDAMCIMVLQKNNSKTIEWIKC